ncbi:hypothetical protein K0M31_015008 [Melipona bicolor]|uniref:Uncharacterized protein n=1 Tax=Melipona bicolor TaxID=60889 RepID=A0AA40FFZ2_9HYME|nr:hypothetical protein K0M31_015008 [Melipona bicolor]
MECPQEFGQNVTSSAEFSHTEWGKPLAYGLGSDSWVFLSQQYNTSPGWCTHSSSRLLSCLRVHLRCSIVQPDKTYTAKALNYNGSQLMPIIVVHAMAIWRTSRWQFVRDRFLPDPSELGVCMRQGEACLKIE